MQLPRAPRQSGKHCFRFYEDCIPFGGVEAEVEDGQSLPRWGFVTAEWVLGGHWPEGLSGNAERVKSPIAVQLQKGP